jgi:N-methylhydantoinase B
VTAGGGGYGPPYLRPVEKVLEDVEDEMVSLEKAREEYGVVIERIDPMTYRVDYEQTERLRKEMKEKR